jgi:hypothetical protein
MFLQRKIPFGSCVLFYLFNLMAIYKLVNSLASNHISFSPCMIFFSCFYTNLVDCRSLVLGRLVLEAQFPLLSACDYDCF